MARPSWTGLVMHGKEHNSQKDVVLRAQPNAA